MTPRPDSSHPRVRDRPRRPLSHRPTHMNRTEPRPLPSSTGSGRGGSDLLVKTSHQVRRRNTSSETLLASRLQTLLHSLCANWRLHPHSFDKRRISSQRFQVPDEGASRFSVFIASEVVLATCDPGGRERVVAHHGVERIVEGRQVPLDDIGRAAGGESGSESICVVARGNHRERLKRLHEVRDDPRHIGHHGVRSVGQLSKRGVGRLAPTMRP